MEAVVSTAGLAEELGVQPETVVRWVKEHRLRAFRQRGRWCIPLEEAEAFAEEYAAAREDEKDKADDFEEEEEEDDEERE